MIYLLIVSIIWAFSFSLIKENLVGIDPFYIAFLRMFLSMLIFLPFLRRNMIRGKVAGILYLIGIVQFGIMYASYIAAYHYLMAYQIALFTIFTPLFISVFGCIFSMNWNIKPFMVATIAVFGSAIIMYQKESMGLQWFGFGLMQCSNAAFALGQMWYKRVSKTFAEGVSDHHAMGILYMGATVFTLVGTCISTDAQFNPLTLEQWFVILYLGGIASAIGFFLWNKGVRISSISTIAIMNNIKIPLAVLVAALCFGENIHILKTSIGGIFFLIALRLARK